MLKIDIPGFGVFDIKYLVMDYNGTLAEDGILIKGVDNILNELSKQVLIHIITADTFGMAASQLRGIPCKLEILKQTDQISGKEKYIDKLGNRHVACIGNGRNDSLMLKHSALGIAVIQQEGASAETLINADIICRNIYDALGLFKNPGRLKATLRS
ncbi:MAG: ATPase P [Spirochaetes bacterium]|nr:ATPase P [Spirochaetota bacterium]